MASYESNFSYRYWTADQIRNAILGIDPSKMLNMAQQATLAKDVNKQTYDEVHYASRQFPGVFEGEAAAEAFQLATQTAKRSLEVGEQAGVFSDDIVFFVARVKAIQSRAEDITETEEPSLREHWPPVIVGADVAHLWVADQTKYDAHRQELANLAMEIDDEAEVIGDAEREAPVAKTSYPPPSLPTPPNVTDATGYSGYPGGSDYRGDSGNSGGGDYLGDEGYPGGSDETGVGDREGDGSSLSPLAGLGAAGGIGALAAGGAAAAKLAGMKGSGAGSGGSLAELGGKSTGGAGAGAGAGTGAARGGVGGVPFMGAPGAAGAGSSAAESGRRGLLARGAQPKRDKGERLGRADYLVEDDDNWGAGGATQEEGEWK